VSAQLHRGNHTELSGWKPEIEKFHPRTSIKDSSFKGKDPGALI
jgi:hypothetical protein